MHAAAAAGVKSFTAVGRAISSAYAVSAVKAMSSGLNLVSTTADALAKGFRISSGAVKFFNTISSSTVTITTTGYSPGIVCISSVSQCSSLVQQSQQQQVVHQV